MNLKNGELERKIRYKALGIYSSQTISYNAIRKSRLRESP